MADLLVVDDEDDLAEVTAIILESAGHDVRRARDGEEGLQRLAESLPDAVVLDVEMPRLSGPEMAYRMLIDDAGKERIPIVLVSGAVDLSATVARVGTPYVLPKPYSAGGLLALIARALEERRPPAPRAA